MITNKYSSTIEHYFDGFNFSNYLRNAALKKNGFEPPELLTTGTTVVGLIFNDGVMIGADTRATRKNMIHSSSMQKIRRLQNNIYCGGSGIAGDMIQVTRLLTAQLELHYKSINGRQVPVVCAKKMAKGFLYRHVGRIVTSLILGGADSTGVHLYSIHFDGTTEKCLFNSIGSGQYGAMGILESRWRNDLDETDARELMLEAVSAGINHDLASGASVDMVIIRSDYSVERCSEVVQGSLKSEREDEIDPEDTIYQRNPKMIGPIQILEEKITYLPPMIRTVNMLPIVSEPVRHPIRRDEVRATLAATSLFDRKRSTHTVDDDEPPVKKKKKNLKKKDRS